MNKKATAYIPSNKVTTTTKWVKKIKSVDDPEFKATDEMKNDYATRYHAYLSDETNHLNYDSVYVTIPAGSPLFEQVKGVDKAIYVQNYKGSRVQATSMKEYDTTNTDLDAVYANDNYDVLPTVNGDWVSTEWEVVNYVDYDPSYSYKATVKTQAYTKAY